MDNEISGIKRFFQSNHIILCDYWLESCVQWFREQNTSGQYSIDTLHKKVYEQWILLDLRDVKVPVLPPNLSDQIKFVLNGTYSLQMMFIMDISRPKHWQLERVRNANSLVTLELDNEGGACKRMLQLVLTDGIITVSAIEYKPIPVLNCNLSPGIKILVTGPVMVRRGQMMLDEANVTILGGEVEEILINYATENILAKALNLPLNPKPRMLETTFDDANTEFLSNRTNVTNQTVNQSTLAISNIVNASVNQRQDRVPEISEEERRISEEIDMMIETEQDINSEICQKAKTQQESFASASRFETDTDDDFFKDMDIDDHLDLIEKQFQYNQEIKLIKDIKQKRCNATVKFKIKAKFKSVLEKFTVNEFGWSLKLLVCDETGDLEAYLGSDIIAELMGSRLDLIMQLKQKIAKKDKAAIAMLAKAIDGFGNKIKNLDCEMEVKFIADEEFPVIVKLG